jgi:hypothetical protein
LPIWSSRWRIFQAMRCLLRPNRAAGYAPEKTTPEKSGVAKVQGGGAA